MNDARIIRGKWSNGNPAVGVNLVPDMLQLDAPEDPVTTGRKSRDYALVADYSADAAAPSWKLRPSRSASAAKVGSSSSRCTAALIAATSAFFGRVISAFIGANVLFGAGYLLCGHGALATAGPSLDVGRIWQAFFFSVHTVATIGYGNVYPVSLYDNLVVVVEITLGLIYFALSTGIAFARFSRPTARFVFSHRALIRNVDGVPTLMLSGNE